MPLIVENEQAGVLASWMAMIDTEKGLAVHASPAERLQPQRGGWAGR
ncbi:hypothetical protein OG259_40875 [Streptomyces sp. NBC_00250]|nr:hypothetical protein [Streptomyces sp. NBC_00250]